jgi:hypothetical protein
VTPAQKELLRTTIRDALAWDDGRVIWQGAPRPVLVGADDSRAGLCILDVISSSTVGTFEERRAIVNTPARNVTAHASALVRLQCDVLVTRREDDAADYCEEIASGIQDETRENALERAQVSLVSVGSILPLPFQSDGAFFSRSVVELTFNVTWERRDRTASGVILTISTPRVDPL